MCSQVEEERDGSVLIRSDLPQAAIHALRLRHQRFPDTPCDADTTSRDAQDSIALFSAYLGRIKELSAWPRMWRGLICLQMRPLLSHITRTRVRLSDIDRYTPTNGYEWCYSISVRCRNYSVPPEAQQATFVQLVYPSCGARSGSFGTIHSGCAFCSTLLVMCNSVVVGL